MRNTAATEVLSFTARRAGRAGWALRTGRGPIVAESLQLPGNVERLWKSAAFLCFLSTGDRVENAGPEANEQPAKAVNRYRIHDLGPNFNPAKGRAMRSLNYVIHIGVHKTGTTLIQRNLEENLAALRAQGVYYLNQEAPEVLSKQWHLLRRVQNEHRFPLAKNALAKFNRAVAEAAQVAGAHTVLMSEENYVGVLPHHQMEWSDGPVQFYPHAGPCLQALTFGIDPRAIRFVMYTRDQASVLRGHYVEGLRLTRMPLTFEQFLDRVDLQTYRFDDLYARVKYARKRSEFVVKPFESIQYGARAFLEDFYATCGLDPARLSIRPEVVYATIDADQAEFLRVLSKEWEASGRDPKYRRLAKIVTEQSADPRKPIEIPQRFLRAVQELTAADTALSLARPQPPSQEHSVFRPELIAAE